MNEFITTGLINLYALFSLFVSDRAVARKKVEDFLYTSVGKKSAIEFLKLFDDLLDYYVFADIQQPKMYEIAKGVYDNLKLKITRKEIILTYTRLIELLAGTSNNRTLELIDDLSKIFDIDLSQKNDLCKFIFDANKLLDSDNVILASHSNSDNFKHFIQRNIKGRLLIYHDPEHSIIIVRLIGSDEIIIESRALKTLTFLSLDSGDTISSHNMMPISYTDIIRVLSGIEKSDKIKFEADIIEYQFPNGAFGLHSFSFNEESGAMIAIMGSSGSGKTTLLNLLNGALKPSKGNIYINGYNIHNEKNQIEGMIGYVPQEDMLIEDLTVFQNLYYSAKLSFSGLSDKEITSRITKVLTQLELNAIKDLKVGSCLNKSISGGQRKRLNIALEIIRESAILLVDEPTSGLSSSDSEKVIRLLREQANAGKLIIINIHQPSSQIFRMFDSLWIIDSGYIIYKGTPLDAITHFKFHAYYSNPEQRECSECGALNPELIFRIIDEKTIDSTGKLSGIRKNSARDWANIFFDSNTLERNKPTEKKVGRNKFASKPSIIKQFSIFFQRNLKEKISNKSYLLTTLLQTPILAVLVAYFTHYAVNSGYNLFNNKHLPIYIFMCVLVSLFSGMMASAEEIIKDRTVLKREKFLNLSWGSYLNSKIALLFIISAFQTTVFVLIGNTILEIEGQFFLYWSVLFSTSCIANLIGLNLSNALNTSAAIYILIPVILIPQILLGGLMIEFDDLSLDMENNNNVPTIGNFPTSRWAFEAIVVGQYRYNDFQKMFFDYEKDFYNYSYYSDILIPELERKISKYKQKQEPISGADKEIIKNELSKIYNKFPILKRKELSFDIKYLQTECAFIREQFRYWKQKSEKALDNEINKRKSQIGINNLEKLRKEHVNNTLINLVKNTNSYQQFRETGTNLIRLSLPIYKEPESNIGEAHFYAPEKYVFDYVFGTSYFNIIIIWLQGLFLYLLLFFNILNIWNKKK